VLWLVKNVNNHLRISQPDYYFTVANIF